MNEKTDLEHLFGVAGARVHLEAIGDGSKKSDYQWLDALKSITSHVRQHLDNRQVIRWGIIRDFASCYHLDVLVSKGDDHCPAVAPSKASSLGELRSEIRTVFQVRSRQNYQSLSKHQGSGGVNQSRAKLEQPAIDTGIFAHLLAT